MTTRADTLWTIAELGTETAVALSENYDGQRNGSVRNVPDLRTIRYYTTRGLLDKPAEMRGRTALYGRRHLLQLVAIKRLQAKGLSLVEIQQELLGATNTALSRIAKIAAPERHRSKEETTERDGFWRQTPTPVQAPSENHSDLSPTLMQGVKIDDAVTLILNATRTMEEDDLEAIKVAAGPLMQLLKKRRLI